MNDVIGIVWYKDEATYRRALAIFTDPKNMPATYEDWYMSGGGSDQGKYLIMKT